MIGTLTEKPGGFIHGCSKSPPSSLHSSVGDTHKALQLKPVLGRGVFLTIPFRAGSALAILVSAAHSTAQPVEGCGCSLGIEEHICMGVLQGELNPSWCPSLAVGMETPQLERLSAPPAAAGAGWLIVGPSLQFWLRPSQM